MGRTTIAFLNVLIFLLALTARVLPGPRTIDDSYITFRYARNLLAGEGFVYNPGERVMGTTTPLYTIVMAGLGAASGKTQAPFPLLALGVNALADAITCLLLFWLGRRLGIPFAGLGAAIVWSVAPYSVTFAVGGLETSVYVLLLTGMFCAHLARRHRLAALLAALALLTRPDALILIGLVALDRAWQLLREAREARSWQDRAGIQDRESYANLIGDVLRQATPELAIFLIPTLLWLGFATVYFGTPIPHSVAAKSLAYRLTREAGLVRLLQHFGTPFMENLTLGSRFPLYGFFLYLFLFLLGARRIVKSDAHAWPWLAYPWAYFVLFAFANPLIFRWYLTPPLPALMLAVLGGVEGIVRDIFRLDGRVLSPGAGRAALAGFCALVLVAISPAWLILHGWTLHPDHGIATPAPQMAWYQLELLYNQAAHRVLQDAVLEDAVLEDAVLEDPGDDRQKVSLAAGDVGVLGYTTGMHILDTVGLNSPESTRYYPLDPKYYTISYAVPPELVLDEQPDYLVVLEVYVRNGLLKEPRFNQEYALVEKIPTDIYGSDGMLIYKWNGKITRKQ